MSKNSHRKAINKCAEEKTKLDAARERRGIYSFLDDDPDLYEQCQKKIAGEWSLRDALNEKSPKQPTRTVPAGSDNVPVIGLKLKRKDATFHRQCKIMGTLPFNRKEFEQQ